MGELAELFTRPRSEKSVEHILKIDWAKFANADLVEDVPLSISTAPRVERTTNGTDIFIRDLQRRIGRWDVKRLARAMILLADPFGDDDSAFKPRLISSEYSDLEQLVNQRYFTEAEYHLSANIVKGKVSALSLIHI